SLSLLPLYEPLPSVLLRVWSVWPSHPRFDRAPTRDAAMSSIGQVLNKASQKRRSRKPLPPLIPVMPWQVRKPQGGVQRLSHHTTGLDRSIRTVFRSILIHDIDEKGF